MSESTGMSTISERIAERVGEELVSLLPQDVWQSLIAQEVEKFKTVTAPKLIEEELTKKYRELVVQEVDTICTPEWSDEVQAFVHANLIKLIEESGGAMLAGILSPSMQMVLSDLRNRLGYNTY